MTTRWTADGSPSTGHRPRSIVDERSWTARRQLFIGHPEQEMGDRTALIREEEQLIDGRQ
ncbi:MAG: hypothetical protein ACLP1X_11750 [Polyangiaceae bacterium]